MYTYIYIYIYWGAPFPTQRASMGKTAGGDLGDDDNEVFSSPSAVSSPTPIGFTTEDTNNVYSHQGSATPAYIQTWSATPSSVHDYLGVVSFCASIE